jgi:hypothetical protein
MQRAAGQQQGTTLHSVHAALHTTDAADAIRAGSSCDGWCMLNVVAIGQHDVALQQSCMLYVVTIPGH